MNINSGRKQILLQNFIINYSEENWYKPLTEALKDISEEEFDFKAGNDINTLRQLVFHLIFWNERWLLRFKGITPEPFAKDNDATFEVSDINESSQAAIKKLFDVMEDWLNELKNSSDEKFDEDRLGRKDLSAEKTEPWWDNMINLNAHNSYHIGQIMLIRKLYKSKNK